jgi:uncharacterized protein (DUF58 family)
MTSTSTPDARRYLDPRVLAKIRGLELRARLAVEGFFSGMHHSSRHGLSIEFADHRVYTQGDDLRHIDWKVFGRTDKYYIKEYEQETNLDVMLAVDCSQSMTYRSAAAPLSKHEYATTLAATISYLALQQQDSVGLALFDERLTFFGKPGNAAHHWKTIVHELDGRAGPAKTSVGRVLGELAERLGHRVLLILISDLFDDPDVILRGLKLMRFRHHEVLVWNVWDEAELRFPFQNPTMFEGLESTGRLLAEPGSLRASYLEEIERFQTRLRHGCNNMQVEYALFSSAAPLDVALSTYLATRSTRLRAGSHRLPGTG